MPYLYEVEQNTLSIMSTGIRISFQVFNYSTIAFFAIVAINWTPFFEWIRIFSAVEVIMLIRNHGLDSTSCFILYRQRFPIYCCFLPIYMLEGGIHLSNKFNIESEFFVLHKRHSVCRKRQQAIHFILSVLLFVGKSTRALRALKKVEYNLNLYPQ